MHHTALLFSDLPIASKILETAKPNLQKALGRQVANFSESVWLANRSRIMDEASHYKFKYGADEGDLAHLNVDGNEGEGEMGVKFTWESVDGCSAATPG